MTSESSVVDVSDLWYAQSTASSAEMSTVPHTTGKDIVMSSNNVLELEVLLRQVEDSEKQAWQWLESLDNENAHRYRDLHEYIATVELNKTNTSEAIAELLQIECRLREQLNRQRTTAQSNSINVDDVNAALENIAGRLRTNATFIDGRLNVESTSRSHSEFSNFTSHVETNEKPVNIRREPDYSRLSSHYDELSAHKQSAANVDDGYEANSLAVKSDTIIYTKELSDMRAKLVAQDEELTHLKKKLIAFQTPDNQTSHAAEALKEQNSNESRLTAEVKLLNSRISNLQTIEKELRLEMELCKSKHDIDIKSLETTLKTELITKDELLKHNSEFEAIEQKLKTSIDELNRLYECEIEERHQIEGQLLVLENTERELRSILEEKDTIIESRIEKNKSLENMNNKLSAQIEFLSKTNEILMDDIDDTNVRMSEELTNCRTAKAAIEATCVRLESECDSLRNTVSAMIVKCENLEKSVELGTHHKSESQRLQHQLDVLLASEEKLMDKLSDKDEALTKMMEELTECKKLLDEQNTELQRSNDALDNCNIREKRYREELDNARRCERHIEDTEKSLLSTVRQLEMSEAVLNTKLESLEADKLQAVSVEASLRHQLTEYQRNEKELRERIIQLEKSELALQAKVVNSEKCTSSLADTLKTVQQMSFDSQFRCMLNSITDCQDDDDDDDIVVREDDVADINVSQHQSHYQLERMTKIEMLSKIYQLERKSVWQRNKIRELNADLENCRTRYLQIESDRSNDTMVPMWMSVVENKVCNFITSLLASVKATQPSFTVDQTERSCPTDLTEFSKLHSVNKAYKVEFD